MLEKIKKYREDFNSRLAAVDSPDQLKQLRADYLGKKGRVSLIMKELRGLSPDEKRSVGKAVNELKADLETRLKENADKVAGQAQSDAAPEFDVTLPGKKETAGSIHPITQVMDEIISIFFSLGFKVEEGPEIESDYYNFEALNIPKDHPARDMQDTFYIGSDHVLRTHTSPVQIHVMEKQQPPLRIIAPGRVYRCDSDISHTPMFHQIEGLMVDENISFNDLKGVMDIFLHQVFGANTQLRFRPSFFPFTSPSAEVDIQCVICKGKGCRVCSNSGWLEILGAGMVDPAVFGFVDYDPEKWTGFAFGLGIERIAMLKFGITDIRLFFENDLRFLRQF